MSRRSLGVRSLENRRYTWYGFPTLWSPTAATSQGARSEKSLLDQVAPLGQKCDFHVGSPLTGLKTRTNGCLPLCSVWICRHACPNPGRVRFGPPLSGTKEARRNNAKYFKDQRFEFESH